MRAATIRDGAISVEEHPDPVPGDSDLLVRVRGAGLNGADMHQLKGRYPAPPGAPQDIPGLELAGEVVECGPGVQRFEPGDRVMSIVAGGGQAELAVVHERTAMPVPEELDWEAAGGVPEVFTTAHDALFTQAGPARRRAAARARRPRAASAWPRSSSAQMAGARVTATVRNPELRKRIDALDVHAIDPEGFEEHGPFDVVLELVGGPNMPGNLAALATGGRIAVIGIGAGREDRAQPRDADGQARDHPRLDAARPPARGQGRHRPRSSSARCCPASPPATSACPSARPTRSTRSPRPTSASRPAASSARSS